MTFNGASEWNGLLDGLETHFWRRRRDRIRERVIAAESARRQVAGKVTQSELWDMVIWAAQREEQGT